MVDYLGVAIKLLMFFLIYLSRNELKSLITKLHITLQKKSDTLRIFKAMAPVPGLAICGEVGLGPPTLK